jgi:hypothetical protein
MGYRTGLLKILFLIVIYAACKQKQKTRPETTKGSSGYKLETAKWLIGNWKDSLAEGFSSETWTKKNDTCFTGVSYFLKGKDTVSKEFIQLVLTGDSLYYIPVVKDQNKGQSVKFTNTLLNANQMVFENPLHDFPQKISYFLIKTDSMLAEISGTLNGKFRSVKFPMTRAR